MATSGTYAFRPQVDDIVRESFSYAGVGADQYGALEVQSAITSLNMLFASWSATGDNNFQVERKTFITIAGQSDYTLDAGTVDVLDALLIKANTTTERPINRVSKDIYFAQPDKTQPGDPIQFWLDRQPYSTRMRFLNAPAAAGDTIVYWRLRQIQDIVNLAEDADISNHWNLAIVFGLAVLLYGKRTDYDQVKMARLEKWADKYYKLATAGETDRTPLHIDVDTGVM